METYENPLNTRYASAEMSALFSDAARARLFRKLWIALAESEKELGLPITDGQIAELKKYADDIDKDFIQKKEAELRHDVMAHIHAYGEKAKSAMPIIHLGATSCFVGDNADLITVYNALGLIKSRILTVISRLADFSEKYAATPCLGFTHLQPAQLTTVGKRAALWIQDLVSDLERLDAVLSDYRLRGIKGATGTQASFLALFDGDYRKVKQLDKLVCEKMGFSRSVGLSGQTYSRKFDYTVLSLISETAQSAYKFSNDLRLLAHMKEIEEPFERSQVGSSAMPYKRNPMRAERISSLARFCISLPVNAAMTASTQWFERTLDDSANKRITTAQAFLALDGVLNLYANIAGNLVVYEKTVEKHVNAELPFMASEEILMACVRAGGDRQALHERIRAAAMESGRLVKSEAKENDLIERLKADPAFAPYSEAIDGIMGAHGAFTGAAEPQTREYLRDVVRPLLKKNKAHVRPAAEIRV